MRWKNKSITGIWCLRLVHRLHNCYINKIITNKCHRQGAYYNRISSKMESSMTMTGNQWWDDGLARLCPSRQPQIQGGSQSEVLWLQRMLSKRPRRAPTDCNLPITPKPTEYAHLLFSSNTLFSSNHHQNKGQW